MCYVCSRERLATAQPIGEELASHHTARWLLTKAVSAKSLFGFQGRVVRSDACRRRAILRAQDRVNAIAPGLFLTPLGMGLNGRRARASGAQGAASGAAGGCLEYGNLAVHIVENRC